MKKAILVTTLTLGIGSLAFASTVSLYSQPDSNSNVIAQVDNQQVKPFFRGYPESISRWLSSLLEKFRKNMKPIFN